MTSAAGTGGPAQAMQVCARQPASELTYPFGEDTAVYKVAGKVFALVAVDEQPCRVTVKAQPDHAAALIRDHEWITVGYHMNKRHWVTLTCQDLTSLPLLEQLIEDSYDLVVDALPAHQRPPADPPRSPSGFAGPMR